jgi:hypothetical protein
MPQRNGRVSLPFPHPAGRTVMQRSDENQSELGSSEPRPAASLLTSCILCKQLHRPEQQFEFHPICPVCAQTSE